MECVGGRERASGSVSVDEPTLLNEGVIVIPRPKPVSPSLLVRVLLVVGDRGELRADISAGMGSGDCVGEGGAIGL